MVSVLPVVVPVVVVVVLLAVVLAAAVVDVAVVVVVSPVSRAVPRSSLYVRPHRDWNIIKSNQINQY